MWCKTEVGSRRAYARLGHPPYLRVTYLSEGMTLFPVSPDSHCVLRPLRARQGTLRSPALTRSQSPERAFWLSGATGRGVFPQQPGEHMDHESSTAGLKAGLCGECQKRAPETTVTVYSRSRLGSWPIGRFCRKCATRVAHNLAINGWRVAQGKIRPGELTFV